MTQRIHLGFEVGSGEAVAVPLKHMAVTGQTQESGKTTTLEALITRSKHRAIAFVTKRGERGFDSGHQILPYFEERTDWEFVESILEARMGQRMKFERAWVVRACKGAKTLADVQENVVGLMAKSKRSMDQDMYMLLNEYLDKVVPEIARLPKAKSIALEPGLNVVNLLAYPEELQMLVIGATLRWIHRHEDDVVTIIPEAWKFVPQGRKTPVKMEVEKLAREGAGLKNYIWIDSQDMAGVEKLALRAASVWLIGVQRETNEVERALDNIPKGIKRPKAEDIAKLKLGEFYACWGEHIHKTYVQPAWASEDQAHAVAIGAAAGIVPPKSNVSEEDTMYKELYETEKAAREELERKFAKLQLDFARLQAGPPSKLSPENKDESSAVDTQPRTRKYGQGDIPPVGETVSPTLTEQLYADIKRRLLEDAPGLIVSLTRNVPEIEVTVERKKIAMQTNNTAGRMAVLIAEGFFDQRRGNTDVRDALAERGWQEAPPNISKAFKSLTQMGFLRDMDGRYQAVEGMKVNIVA